MKRQWMVFFYGGKELLTGLEPVTCALRERRSAI